MRPLTLVARAGFGVALLAAPLAPPVAAVSHAPRLVAVHAKGGHHGHGGGTGWTSSNWSGYAITGGPFTSVTGQWTVPSVSASAGATYSSSWVGIDGFNDSSLIQTGTEQDYVAGSARYSAWWEILPAAETTISTLTVHPGDHMSASIAGSGGSWTITISDTTTGRSFSTSQSYSGPLTSAEWIEEAPSVGGRIATLANYGRATFDPGTANGGNPGLVAADSGAMVQNRVQVSTPSVPDGDTDGFNVAYGSTAPPAPGS